MYTFLFLSSFCICSALIYFLFKNYSHKEALIIISSSFFVIISLVAGVAALNPTSTSSEISPLNRAPIVTRRFAQLAEKPPIQTPEKWLVVQNHKVSIVDPIIQNTNGDHLNWKLNAIVKNDTNEFVQNLEIVITSDECKKQIKNETACIKSQQAITENIKNAHIPPNGISKISVSFVLKDTRKHPLFHFVVNRVSVEPIGNRVDTMSTCGDCGHSERVAYNESGSCEYLDLKWPVKGRVIQHFKDGGDGINIAVPEGTQVKAVQSGEVVYAGAEFAGYGNLIVIKHDRGFVTAYAHNYELLTKRGDKVEIGQLIAKSGMTGNVNTPQLHFETRRGSTPFDPLECLSRKI